MVDRDPPPNMEPWEDYSYWVGMPRIQMYPVGSNGASQAIIDARVLARELATQPSIDSALAAYGSRRQIAGTSAVVMANRGGRPGALYGSGGAARSWMASRS